MSERPPTPQADANQLPPVVYIPTLTGPDDAVTSGEHLLGDTAHAAASGWKHLWD